MRSQVVTQWIAWPILCIIGSLLPISLSLGAAPAIYPEVEHLRDIHSAMTAVLRRRLITLIVPITRPLYADPASVPSSLLSRMPSGPSSAFIKSAFSKMLEDLNAGTPISSTYTSGCEDNGTDVQLLTPTLNTEEMEQATKRLDAAFQIEVAPCPERRMRLNAAAANQISETNSKYLYSEEQIAARRIVDAPFIVNPAAFTIMEVGQAFRFSNNVDAQIPLPRYLAERARVQLKRIQDKFLESPIVPNISVVVFDRNLTGARISLLKNPNGFFNAIAEGDVTYISPTLVRAAFVACASETTAVSSLLRQIDSEINKSLSGGGTAPADLIGALQSALNRGRKIDKCVESQLSFLIAHEMAHSIFALSSLEEERADCMASWYTRKFDGGSLGIFQKVIFEVAKSPVAPQLGVKPQIAKALQCRESRLKESSTITKSEVKEAYASCKSLAIHCLVVEND